MHREGVIAASGTPLQPNGKLMQDDQEGGTL
jgi:hypothetical protein